MSNRAETAPDQHEPDSATDELTRGVGVLVRTTRSRRGLTRKNLAFHSDVSERYLARVESGEANISVVLLSRIAAALDVPILSLLPGDCMPTGIRHAGLYKLLQGLDQRQLEQSYRLLEQRFSGDGSARVGIALVGLRGAGKSTLGALLAQRFKVPFVRLDEVISEMSGLELGELISLVGQRDYRRYELEALKQTLGDYRQVVVEAGGSLVSERETYDLLRASYYTIWLRASPEEHLERVRGQGDVRPMKSSRQPMEDLKAILSERSEDYRLADYHLTTSGRTVEECLEELAGVAQPYLKTRLSA